MAKLQTETEDERAQIATDAILAAVEFAAETVKITRMQPALIRGTAVPAEMRKRLAAMHRFCAMIER
jgi:hypothetical protein